MKCDNCIFLKGESATQEYPYPWVYCGKGHWDGIGAGEDPKIDPWIACKDFEEKLDA